MSDKLFIVIYDDGDSITCPMVWDKDCEGAVQAWMGRGKIAAFTSRQSARRAIRISTKYNQLLKEQGKPQNTDFTDAKQFIQVVELCLPAEYNQLIKCDE